MKFPPAAFINSFIRGHNQSSTCSSIWCPVSSSGSACARLWLGVCNPLCYLCCSCSFTVLHAHAKQPNAVVEFKDKPREKKGTFITPLTAAVPWELELFLHSWCLSADRRRSGTTILRSSVRKRRVKKGAHLQETCEFDRVCVCVCVRLTCRKSVADKYM